MALDIGLLNVLVSLGLADGAGEKLADDIGKAVGPAGDKIGQSLSDKIAGGMTKAGKGLTAGITAPVLAIGGAAIAAGMDVDGALDTIRVKTGATGKELRALEDDFKAVSTTSTGSFERVGEVVADLNTRLGLTGEPLQTLANQLLDLEQITGNAVNLDSVTRVLSAFSIPADQASATLDKLFRASQTSGVEFGKLSEQLVSQSAAFAELGFGLDETAALLGQFEAAGVNTGTVLGALRANIVKAAKEGKDAATFFKDGVKEIEGFLAAGDTTSAQTRAKELFGARTFVDALDAIKRGQFDITGTVDAIQNGQDTIAGLADVTEDFPEKFEKLKKQVGLALLPIAETLIPAIADALEAVTPIVAGISKAFAGLSPETRKVIAVIAGALATLGPVLLIGAKIVGAIKSIIAVIKVLQVFLVANPWLLVAAAAIAAVVLIVKNWDTIVAFFQAIWDGIKNAAFAVWDAIKAIASAVGDFIIAYFKVVAAFWGAIWDGIKAATSAVWDAILGVVRAGVELVKGVINGIVVAAQAVWDALKAGFEFVLGVIRGYFDFWLGFIRGVFDRLREAVSIVTEFFKTVFGTAFEVIKAAFQRVFDFYVAVLTNIKEAVGGVAEFFKNAFNGAWDALKNGVQGVYEFFLGIFEKIRGFIADIVNKVKNLPGEILGGLGGIAKAIIPGFADGGVAPGGELAIVGERGPELIVPRRTSTVFPNETIGQLAGGATTNYEINIVNPTQEPASTSIPAALRRANYLRGN